MSLQCPKCNKENTDKAVFCSNCGETLDKDKDYKRYDSIGGWLFLLGISIAFLPFKILAVIGELFKTLENAELINLYPKIEELLNNELTVNYMLLIISFFIVYFFFTKKIYFPKIFIGWLILNIFILIYDVSMVSSLAINNEKIQSAIYFETSKDILMAIVIATILIPYMLISKRVKGTFTK